ncbi:MAG: hypothetical protein HC810_08390 [Acaryochloridaceae cyanobacterium RL_2_7]|nr:hypothetical protein [Acaryochloridaceae cyanobacterium RL_2_7]
MSTELASLDPATGYVVVANRGSSRLSLFNSSTGGLLDTIELEGSEPMYVSYLASLNQFAVGDRANSQVIFIDSLTLDVVNSVSVGEDDSLTGVFHQWASLKENQFWVVNDVSLSLSCD